MRNTRKISKGLDKILQRILLGVIHVYQKTVSPDHGLLARLYPQGYCQFYPSCSEYSRQAITKYGAGRGTIKALWRILRCNPFSKGGLDELPSK